MYTRTPARRPWHSSTFHRRVHSSNRPFATYTYPPCFECVLLAPSELRCVLASPLPSVSICALQACELRDGGSRYNGKGVLGAVKNVNEVLGPMVTGMDPTKQQDLDDVSVRNRPPLTTDRLDTWSSLAGCLLVLPRSVCLSCQDVGVRSRGTIVSSHALQCFAHGKTSRAVIWLHCGVGCGLLCGHKQAHPPRNMFERIFPLLAAC